MISTLSFYWRENLDLERLINNQGVRLCTRIWISESRARVLATTELFLVQIILERIRMHVMLPLRNVVLRAQIWKTAYLGSHPRFATDYLCSYK